MKKANNNEDNSKSLNWYFIIYLSFNKYINCSRRKQQFIGIL